MRWEQLFADLEAELEAQDATALRGEVTDRTRREAGLVGLADRLRASAQADIGVRCLGSHVASGRLLDTGPDWSLLQEQHGRQVLVPHRALVAVTGLGSVTSAPGSAGEVERRLDLRWALRGLARDRAGVRLLLVDGAHLTGTVDRVGADHLELAEHPQGEARRARAVRQVVAVPLTALAAVLSDLA